MEKNQPLTHKSVFPTPTNLQEIHGLIMKLFLELNSLEFHKKIVLIHLNLKALPFQSRSTLNIRLHPSKCFLVLSLYRQLYFNANEI